jgi:transcriptional regulator GlxA family with amidase domain
MRDLRALITAHAKGHSNNPIQRNSQALLNVVLARNELRWHAPPPEKLLHVRSHIETNLKQKLSCNVLARLAGMSEAGFNRAFRRHFSNSPARFVIEIRVREAASRLITTEDKIDSVAEQTGFPNRAYFSRIFKQVTGESPAGFRRSHQIP